MAPGSRALPVPCDVSDEASVGRRGAPLVVTATKEPLPRARTCGITARVTRNTVTGRGS